MTKNKNKYDIVVLAGGGKPLGLSQGAVKGSIRALTLLQGKRLLVYLLQVLQQLPQAGRIAVVGGPQVLEQLPQMAQEAGVDPKRLIATAAGGNLPESAQAGVEALGAYEACTAKVLFVCEDIPFVGVEALEAFLQQAEATGCQGVYPVLPKEKCLQVFPAFRRTFFTLKEGSFTGGNVTLAAREIFPRCLERAQEVFARRKSPLQLAGWLGWGFVLKWLLRQLTLQDIAEKASDLLGFRGCAVISCYPELGMDIDKPQDLAAAEAYLLSQRP